MVDCMCIAFSRYGALRMAYPEKVDAIATLENKLLAYKSSGNARLLVDIANYAMIEYMHPKHPDHHEEEHNSKGRVWVGEKLPARDKNNG